jgi:hypothetical protein
MTRANTSVGIDIVANDRTKAGFDSVLGSVRGISHEMESARNLLAGGIVGGLIGHEAVGFLKESIQDYARLEAGVVSLNAALRNVGDVGTNPIEGYHGFIEQLKTDTTMTGTEIRSLMQLGASMGHQVGVSLENTTRNAIGLAKALGIDVESALRLVIKAEAGHFETLARYGLVMKDGATQQEKMALLIERSAEGFKMASAEVGTYMGQLKQLGKDWEELRVSIGKKIIGPITIILQGAKGTLDMGPGATYSGFAAEANRKIVQFLEWLGKKTGVSPADLAKNPAINWFRKNAEIWEGKVEDVVGKQVREKAKEAIRDSKSSLRRDRGLYDWKKETESRPMWSQVDELEKPLGLSWAGEKIAEGKTVEDAAEKYKESLAEVTRKILDGIQKAEDDLGDLQIKQEEDYARINKQQEEEAKQRAEQFASDYQSTRYAGSGATSRFLDYRPRMGDAQNETAKNTGKLLDKQQRMIDALTDNNRLLRDLSRNKIAVAGVNGMN